MAAKPDTIPKPAGPANKPTNATDAPKKAPLSDEEKRKLFAQRGNKLHSALVRIERKADKLARSGHGSEKQRAAFRDGITAACERIISAVKSDGAKAASGVVPDS